jgi:phenylacetate-CoA ligase
VALLDTIRFAQRTSALGAVSGWSPRRVERMAQARLRRLVGFAAANSPFYARRFAQVELGRFTLADLPPVSKDELRDHFESALTDRAVTRDNVAAFTADTANLGKWFLGRYAVSHTSGSQGPPLPLVQDRASLELLFGVMSARANAGRNPGIVEGLRRLTSPARVAVVTLHRGFYPSAAAMEFMAEMTWPFTRVARFSAADPHLVERLNEFQPHSLVGYASVLDGLAMRAEELRLAGLRQIANSSEQLTAKARARIESAFKVTVMDHYGLGECLFLSDGCPTDGGAHVNADWAILENVDDQYRPVPPGVAGRKVLVTNLANRVQPFIRYEVNDRIVMADGPCRCGSRLPRIARIEGRTADALWFSDSRGRPRPLPGVLFHDCVDSLDQVREWKAIQSAPDRITLQLERIAGAVPPIDESTLLNRLRAAGLPDGVRVDIESVSRLEPDPRTGKFRRIESHIAPDIDVADESGDIR